MGWRRIGGSPPSIQRATSGLPTGTFKLVGLGFAEMIFSNSKRVNFLHLNGYNVLQCFHMLGVTFYLQFSYMCKCVVFVCSETTDCSQVKLEIIPRVILPPTVGVFCPDCSTAKYLSWLECIFFTDSVDLKNGPFPASFSFIFVFSIQYSWQ